MRWTVTTGHARQARDPLRVLEQGPGGQRTPDACPGGVPSTSHNALDQVPQARGNADSWDRFNPGLDATPWYLLRIHQTLSHQLPGSLSTELVGKSVKKILSSEAYRRIVHHGVAPVVWVSRYLERPETHRSRSAHDV